MTCRDLLQFLADCLDQELSDDVRRRFEAHLAICRACRDYLNSYQATIRMSKITVRSQEPEVANVPEELIRAILATRSRG